MDNQLSLFDTWAKAYEEAEKGTFFGILNNKIEDEKKDTILSLLVNWQSTNREQKEEILLNIKEVLKEELKFENSPKLDFYSENNRIAGTYYRHYHFIDINMFYALDARRTVETLCHELAHAKQKELIETKSDSKWEIWDREFEELRARSLGERVVDFLQTNGGIEEKWQILILGETKVERNLKGQIYRIQSIEKVANEYAKSRGNRIFGTSNEI